MSEQPVGAIWSIAAKRNTQREYETVLILRPSVAKPDIVELVRRMQAVITERGARLLKVDNWGLRTLSFSIAGNTRGIYMYWRYLGGSDIVAEFERRLRNIDYVMRYYTVKIDEDVDPSARPSELTEDMLESVAESGPDPIDLQREAEEAARAAAAERAAQLAAEASAAAADQAQGARDQDREEEGEGEP